MIAWFYDSINFCPIQVKKQINFRQFSGLFRRFPNKRRRLLPTFCLNEKIPGNTNGFGEFLQLSEASFLTILFFQFRHPALKRQQLAFLLAGKTEAVVKLFNLHIDHYRHSVPADVVISAHVNVVDLLADPVAFERNLDQNDVRDLIGQNIGNIAETELLDHHRIFQLKSHVAFRIKKAVDKKSLFMGNFVIRGKIGGQSAREQILGKTAIGGRQHQFQTEKVCPLQPGEFPPYAPPLSCTVLRN